MQHQLCVLWGIGHTKAALKEITEMEQDDTVSSSELSDNSDWQGSQHGSTSGLTDDLTHMDFDQDARMDVDDSRTLTPMPESISLSLGDESDSDEANSPTPDSNKIFNFTIEELEII